VVHHDGSPDSYPDPPFDEIREYAEQKVGYVETMDDSFSVKRPWNDHPCTHETLIREWIDTNSTRQPVSLQIGAEHGSPDPSEWTELWSDWDTYAGKGFWIAPNDPDPTLAPIIPSDQATVDRAANALNDHVNNVLNPVRQSISLANFVLEIDDIKRSADTLLELMRHLNPSNQILNWQLGVKPLIGDLNGLVNTIGNLSKDVDRVLRSQNDPIRITTERNISPEGGSNLHVPPTSSEGTRSHFQYDTLADEVTVKFVTWVKYDLSHLSSIGLTCKSALRSIGFTNPIQVVWNAIPYSFVVDWFFNVSAMLRKFDLGSDISKNRSIIRQTSHLTIVKKCDLFTTSFDGAFSDRAIFPDRKVGTTTRKYYRRWVGFPTEWTNLPSTGDPHLRELVLSILLGGQYIIPKARSFWRWEQKRFRRIKPTE
jgi:hypothetical protein